MPDPGWTRRVKLQQLRAILAVADHASLVKASERIGLSQPAISKIINEVEADLGVRLFVRNSRGTHATGFGEMLAGHAKRVFSQLEQVEQEIHDAREGLSGHVVVGALLAGSAQLLPRAMARLHRRLPGIRTTVVESTYEHLVPSLHRGSLDFIVGRLPAYRYREGLAVEPLYQEEIHFVVRPGHQALALATPDLADLVRWPWILPLPDTTLRQMLEAAFLDRNLELPVAPCESLSVAGNRAMILESDCIGTFPSRVVARDLEAGLLARLPVTPALPFGPVGISYLKGTAFSKAAEALLAEMRSQEL
ncbi:LysR family transcriptional regulator [Alloalcanivorax sp. C16-2]|uniref:LysR family transcriptional regulator n=1 Tax=Alloalcanivorax TaxID=3020832 RepID=UPI001933DA80|nr:LysR family transcriptional regulator [Alloalcanivorax marinus]MBL7249367.1 LysR family transcriptional regulator [Alloalcanivorax marinus]